MTLDLPGAACRESRDPAHARMTCLLGKRHIAVPVSHCPFLPPMAARALGKMAASLAAATARASATGPRTPGVLLLNRQRVCGLAATAHRPLGNSAFQPLQLRSFSASAVASATDIAAIVSDELKYEQESYTKPVRAWTTHLHCKSDAFPGHDSPLLYPYGTSRLERPDKKIRISLWLCVTTMHARIAGPHRALNRSWLSAELHTLVQALTPPAGWEITEKAGSSKVSLTRDYGEEVVQVDFTAREYVSQALTIAQIHANSMHC